MAFDQTTRGRLQKFVNASRELLSEELTRQLQATYGLDPKTGTVADLSELKHLDNRERQTAQLLREILQHYIAATPCKNAKEQTLQALDRLVREQAFTVLNRMAALRMMEARGVLVETVAKGYDSQGFKLYRQLAATSQGETGDAYRNYLFSLFDEFSVDLELLFDCHGAQGRLFPRESALLELLEQINHPDIEHLWAEDETIGWIYQYFNSQEERKKMRKESQAPRNSRELAVRNQFFTPRYVVEFLVDNTLGRIWFDATQGNTSLYDRCQYLLVKPEELEAKRAEPTPHTLRDPRTLKLLDPACGSMHFGLYAFDLFLEIYREAWAWEQQQGPGSLDLSTQPDAGFKPLSQTYTDEAAYLRDVPRLIIEHNIYGVDIDPRAAQIATLALWLRAQRAWYEAGVKAPQRPIIGQGHVIAAIAPPAEKELRQQFAEQLDTKDAELFEKTLQLLHNLPELGVLLQVEQELPKLIKQVYGGSGDGLFAAQEQETWQQAEQRLRQALSTFTEQVSSSYQSRLFALDALQGLRLIDLTREVFDVVVMNPPFGALPASTKTQLSKSFPHSKSDLLAIFVERGLDLLSSGGLLGAITSRAPFYLSSMDAWRDSVVYEKGEPKLFADLGMGVMDDAMVEAAAYVIGKSSGFGYQKINCFRALTSSNKEWAIKDLVRDRKRSDFFDIAVDVIRKSPGQSFAYWIPEGVLNKLSKLPSIDPSLLSVRLGLQTGDDWRFLREWWEVKNNTIVDVDDRGIPKNNSSDDGQCWATYTKTDSASPWFSPLLQVVRWRRQGEEYNNFLDHKGKPRARLQNVDAYFKPGFSYMLRSDRLVPYIVPAGAIPTAGRAQGFGEGDDLLTAFIIASSNLGSSWARLTGEKFAWPKFQAGMVQSIPYQELSYELLEELKNVISKIYSERRGLFEYQEPYREFIKPAFFNNSGIDGEWSRRSLIGRSFDVRLAKEYGLTEQEYELLERDLQEAISFNAGIESISESGSDEDTSTTESSEKSVRTVNKREVFEGLISYAVGLCFGRWDVRAVLNEKTGILDSDPFKPLPITPPGMLVWATEKVPSEQSYPIKLTIKGLLSSEDVGASELVSCVRECFELLSEVRPIDENMICTELGVQNLEVYVNRTSGFFADHLNRYTAGGRKAPIYWPLSTASGSYTLWLYYPELTSQTLFTAVNDFVEPKLNSVRDDLNSLRSKGGGRSKQEEKELEKLEDLEQELADLRDTLLEIAPGYRPNQDDGVQITAAPLWSLFRHKPWQKVLKDTWKQLEKGDYDWAHLALNYWPDRVLHKCHEDRSLAIAHDVEEQFWEEVEVPLIRRGKDTGETKLEWQPKDLSEAQLQTLINQVRQERSL